MSAPATEAAVTYRYPLNSQDRFLLLWNEMLQGHALPGLQCQTHVWWNGRVDLEELRRALDRLAKAHPVATARLVRTPKIGSVHWAATLGDTPPLEVVSVEDDSDATVLRVAEAWLRRPIDLEHDPPLRFVLVRRPAAGDVLLVLYSHVLMDGKAPEQMLLEAGREEGPRPAERERRDEQAEWLRRQPRLRRVLGMSRLTARTVLRRVRRTPVVTMAAPGAPLWAREGNRIEVRSLEPEATARLRRRVRDTIGLENMAPAILASAFRAVARLQPGDDGRGVCCAYVPISLRATPGLHVPVFCNLSSLLLLTAPRSALSDRDVLLRDLHGQMRDQIRTGEDLALSATGWWLTQRRRPVAWRFVWRRKATWTLTLGFGYHGAVSPALDRLFGAPVGRLYTIVGVPYPPGACLSANESGGALHLGLTWEAGAVPLSHAEEFLDALIADLVA